MPSSKVTLKTVALHCGYSVNTVSRALRDDSGLPLRTREYIQKAAGELGYIRNSLASSLRSGKTQEIAIIVDEIQNPYYSTLITSIDSILRDKGYIVIILCYHNDINLVRQMVSIAISRSVDGVFFFPRNESQDLAEMIRKNSIPLVLLSREIPDFTADVVRFDDFGGGALVAKRFLELGHRRFLYIAGPNTNRSQSLRQSGFLSALREAGIPETNIRIIQSEDMLASISSRNIEALLSPIDYTAMFSFNDEMAYYVVNQLRAKNFQIPQRLSICGFDCIRQAMPYLPPLSSITGDPEYHMAKIAVSFLLNRIEHPDIPVQSSVIPVLLTDADATISQAPCK